MLLTVLVALAPAIAASGCRRGASSKSTAQSGADPARLELAPPQRSPPPLPPLLPVPEATARPPAATATGGSLRVHLDSEPTHLNPLADPDAAALAVVTGLVYETLIECPSPGASGGYRPALAESWQTSPDGSHISLRLRAGVKWHDGRVLNVLDVQASLEPLLSAYLHANPLLRASMLNVSAIELGAERTIRLALKRPSDLTLRALCDIPILPDHLLRGAEADPASLLRQPIGTGPFRVAGWERGKRIKLVRSPAYWGGAPGLEEITFEIDGDGARALMRTRRGEIDVLPRVLTIHYPDEVDPVTLHGTLTLARLRPERWAYVAVNHRHAPLSDEHFRRALGALWDRERFARDLHQGLAHPIGAPPFAEIVAPPGGRDRAVAILADTGYIDSDADGVRDIGGKAIRESLLVAAGARAAATEAHAFVFEARKAGLLVDLVSVDPATLLARVKNGDFDLALMMWEGSPDEDPGLVFGPAGPFNYAGYRSAPVDQGLEAVRTAPGPRERRQPLAALGEVLAREQPMLFLYRFDVPILIANRVHGLAAVGGRLDFRRAWVDP